MAEKRKLLQEVEKTYKKVDEGIEIFEEIMTKMYEANSENQRDKFQDDLKREIKKLQRLRDAIKGWQVSPDIKDKDKLQTYRRLIETKMEHFKDIERENKTKPHSKQGLSAEEKMDPLEKEKVEAIEWLKTKIRQIQDDIDKTEVKMEAVSSAATGRKKRGTDDSSKEKMEELKKRIESLNYHITNLEVCMRLVTNDEKDPKEVMDVLQDALDSFIEALDPDSGMDPKELDPVGVYEELDIEEYIPQLVGARNDVSSPPPPPTPPPSMPYNAVATGLLHKNPTPPPVIPSPAVSASVAATPVPPPTPPPSMPYNAVVTGLLHKNPTPPPVIPSPAVSASVASTPVPTPSTPAVSAPLDAAVSASIAATPVQTPSTPAVSAPLAAAVAAPTAAPQSLPPPSTDDLMLFEILQSDTTHVNNHSSEIPPWLAVSPLGRRELTAEEKQHISRLDDAFRTIPHKFDSEPQRPQMPRIPYQGFPSYPQFQQPLFQTIDYYMRLSPETLLFIFYYMEGSKAQLLAAQALKKLSWRFHTKYLMWFQRHEEPKVITDDYEQGSYVYFDFERWAQRKKDQFMFEYRYLEDRDLTALL